MPHPLTVRKADFMGNDIQRNAPPLEHQSCHFYTQMLDSLRRRLAGFRREGSKKMARAETCDFGELLKG